VMGVEGKRGRRRVSRKGDSEVHGKRLASFEGKSS
jgi:hypothetical protein